MKQGSDKQARGSDSTHITVILDRTGSMECIRDDTIGGFNTFLDEQKAEEGETTLTLVQFDSQDPYEVIHAFRPISDVSALTRKTFVPRASTPLLDAIGRGINDLESQIAKKEAKERPSNVIMAVITDGQENASKEFTKDRITKMIEEKTEKEDWQFVFLSADLAAIHEAGSLGFKSNAMLPFSSITSGFMSFSKQTSLYRKKFKEKFSFDDEDREHPDDPEKKKS